MDLTALNAASGSGRGGRTAVSTSTEFGTTSKLITRAIWSYVSVMPREQASRLVATYQQQYSRTMLAWSTSTNSTPAEAYVRIQGPRVWIEISRTDLGLLVGEAVHYHSIERDIENDYGACL